MTTIYEAETLRIALSPRTAFGRKRAPVDAASLAVVALLSLLFAAAIICAGQPPHLVDPALAALQGGL